MDGEVEVVWAHCRHVGAGVMADPVLAQEVFSGLTVLVSFDANAGDRLALRSLVGSLAFAQCDTAQIDGVDWPERLAERLSEFAPTFVSLALHVGRKSFVVAETVQAAVDGFWRVFGNAEVVCVLVAGADERWAGLKGLSGAITGPEGADGNAARDAFLMLAMLMAPNTLTGIDADDLLMGLGTPVAPAVLLQSLSLREGGKLALRPPPSHERFIHGAQHLVCVPLIAAMQLSDLRALHNGLRSMASGATEVILFAAVDPLTPGSLPPGTGLVLTLCKAASSSPLSSTHNGEANVDQELRVVLEGQ